MFKKMLKQTWICLLIVMTFILAKNSGIAVLQSGTDAVLNYMSICYTMNDVKAAAGRTAEVFSNITNKTSDAVDTLTGKPVYGEPIDEKYEGNETVVYAVGGGKVTAVGENEEIGKYIRITHGDQAESLYGNLKSINVSTPVNVKKGEIIGIYSKTSGKDFYYSFNEF